MSRPFKLYRLQQIDSQLDWMHHRLREIETALSDDSTLRQATESAHQANTALQKCRLNLRQAEENVRLHRLKIEQNEATLYGGKVRNPKELQDLQNDVAALKRYQSVLEDRQLEAMLEEEEAVAVYEAAENEVGKVQAQMSEQHGLLMEEQKKLLKDITRFNEERQAAAGSIAAEDMQIYDQLRKQRRGIAITKVVDRACSACGSTLSATLLNAAHSPNQLTRCETCGRILYIG